MDINAILAGSASWVLWPAAGLFLLLIIMYILRDAVWLLRYPFLFLNWLMWILYNPLRDAWTDPQCNSSSLVFRLLFYSGIAPLYWLIIHLALTPVRLINALFFNIVLYWTVIFCDSIAEFIHPRLSYGEQRQGTYLYRWFRYFPYRMFNIFRRNGGALLEGILMTGVDVVLPTFTMYHGTSFKGIATNIAQAGRWYVGGGDYAGCGIYFGFYRHTGEHYAKGADNALIVARVCIFPCRNSATLPGRIRKKIGNDGEGISKGLPFPFCSIEHWRDHSYAQWFEYCLIQPGKAGKYIRTWRARPLCVLKNGIPKRIWGGLSLWTGGAGGIGIIIFSWGLIVAIFYALGKG